MRQTINYRVSNYATKVSKYQGKDHLVVPVILLKEGVHEGSGGALLYTGEELSKYPASWNGAPVPVYHPTNNDVPVSCNDPSVMDAYNIGTLFNVIYDQASKALKGEIFIDVEKALADFEEVYNSFLNKEPMDVSTGLVFDMDATPGEWNGDVYEGIVKNMVPDHIAILPGQEGACSWEDGCGIRVNAKGQTFVLTSKTTDIMQINRVKEMIANELSHDDLRKQLSVLVYKKHPRAWIYIQEVYDNYFVYELEPKSTDGAETIYYKIEYEIKEEEATLIGIPAKVERVVTWTTINNKNIGGTNMGDKTLKECCAEKVQLIVENEAIPFGEDQRELVETFTEETADAIMANAAKAAVVVDYDEKLAALTTQVETLTAQNEELISNAAKKDGDDKPAISIEDQEALNFGKAQIKSLKAENIVKILANKRNTFTEEQLNKKDVDELGQLADLAVPVDYTGNAPPKFKIKEEADNFEMPAVNWTGDKK